MRFITRKGAINIPYIKQDQRTRFESLLTEARNQFDIDGVVPGELNYLITKLCHLYIETQGENYQHYNDLMGVLAGVQMELYRKKTAGYEDLKEAENGRV